MSYLTLQACFQKHEDMVDNLSEQERSKLMSRVRSGDTKPEWILRSGLHRLGFRYSLKNGRLPGKPDLVFPKYKAVVFVHGCFWHRHPGCKDASIPKTNTLFWQEKFSQNVERDKRARKKLRQLGWRVLTVWECELTRLTVETVLKAADWLKEGIQRQSGGCSLPGRALLLKVAEQKVRFRISRDDEK